MKLKIRFLCILAYLSLELTTAKQSTRERIALHKQWLEQRTARKRFHLQQSSKNNNQTQVTELWQSFGRHPNDELNEVSKSKEMKSSLVTSPIKSKYREKMSKYSTEFILKNDSIPNVTKIAMPINTTVANVTESVVKLKNDKEIIKSESTSIDLSAATLTITERSIQYNTTVDGSINSVIPKRKKKLSNAMWGRWEKWAKCSRSCGGGIMSQFRPCLSRNTSLVNRTSNECIGLQKRYRICNEQSCPDHEIDFREQQCIFFNNQSFRGTIYSWEAYILDEAECELNCKPIGMEYFATLKDQVVDGTSCYSPVDFIKQSTNSGRAMCVQGVCKAIHSSGILTGAFMNNGAVRCGGTVCNSVSRTFTEDSLPIGYFHVATIPAGASNISILEVKNSKNFLVLKRSDQTFIINGNNRISENGVYEAAGTVFEYRRIDDAIDDSDENIEGVTEWLTATGPLSESIHLSILVQGRNPGVKYEYLMPINVQTSSTGPEVSTRSVEMEADMPPSATNDESNKLGSEEKPKRKNSYVWKVVSYSSCSKSCGGGTLTPIIRCVREGTSKFFAHKRCAHHSKPVLDETTLKCNTQPCPPYWKFHEWSACNCGLPNEKDYQTRKIKCVQELESAGIVLEVDERACLEKKPENRQECDCPKQQVDYVRNPNKRNNHENGQRHQHHHHNAASITLIGNSTIGKKAHHLENKKTGIWLASDWTEQCSTKCGEGTQYRSIFCDRSLAKSERCDIRLTPETTRSCNETERCNVGDWFTGPWSQCFGDCFNLMRSRSVFCIKDDQIVGDNMCMNSNNVDDSGKPITMEKCKPEDVSYCKPKWHYSEWTECSRGCGSGTQRRFVKCFEPDLKETILKETDNCKYSERPQVFKSCNMDECDEESQEISTPKPVTTTTTKKRIEPKVRLIQNDSIPKCEDKFPNCNVVVRARLCTYNYYTENCCAACKEAVAIGY